MSGFEVTHDSANSEFVAIDDDGARIGVLQYELIGDVIDLQHTVVQRAAGGRGVGSALVVAALDRARADDLRVVPTCPFVPAVIERHPEYADLVRR